MKTSARPFSNRGGPVWSPRTSTRNAIFFVVFGVLFFVLATALSAYGDTFSWRRKLTINKARVEAPGTDSSLSNFPVLVSLSGTWLKTTGNGGQITDDQGDDIIFRDSDGVTQLWHDIDEYDGSASGGTLIAWVRMPTLYENPAQNQEFYIYYKNSGITSATEKPLKVWDTADGWRGVWHLDESPSDGGTHADSASSIGNCTFNDSGTAPVADTSATGKIGGADYLGGDGDYLSCASIATSDYSSGTLSMWIFRDSAATGRRRIAGNNTAFEALQEPQSGKVYMGNEFYIGDTPNYTPEITSTWHHAVWTWDDSSDSSKVYLDGSKDTDSSTLTDPNVTATWMIAARPGKTSTDTFYGTMDEVRIMTGVVRTDEWVTTEYYNQDDPFSEEESDPLELPCPTGAFTLDNGFLCLGVQESAATAITLSSFEARGEEGSVRVSWETGSEAENFGFNLFRAPSPEGPFTKLNDRLIPARAFPVGGGTYFYEDRETIPGELYYYRLEDVDVYGSRTFHGPICVDWDGDEMPDDWEIENGLDPGVDDSAFDWDFDGLINLDEYDRGTDPFDPDTDGDGILDGEESGRRDGEKAYEPRTLTRGVEVLSADETGVLLELRTDEFAAETVEGGGEIFSRLGISAYIHGSTGDVGKPELPTKGVLLDLPEGKGATLEVVGTEAETYSGYWIYPVPERVVDGEGGLERIREVFRIDDLAYTQDALYPGFVARLGETFFFRDQRKVQVLFSPLAFNPVTRELVHYQRIRVRIRFQDSQEGFSLIAGASGPTVSAWSPPSLDPAYKIFVSEEGIYWLSGPDFEGTALSQVRLYHLGQEIAIAVYDQDGDDLLETADGDYIEFFARSLEAQYTKYTKDNVYWLVTSGGTGSPKRMASLVGTPGGASVPAMHSAWVHHEENRRYWRLAPGADSLERWFFDPAVSGDGLGGGGVPVDFTVPAPGAAGLGTLTLSMLASYSTEHEIRVSVNGAEETFRWSGISFYEGTIDDVPLVPGDNTVTIECLSGEDAVEIDWFEVAYPRAFVASGDMLQFSHEAGFRYQVPGFTTQDLLVFDITDPGEVYQITDFGVTGSGPYTVEFEPDPSLAGERTYFVLTADQIKTPSGIVPDRASLLGDSGNGADYILITLTSLGWDENGDLHPWLTDLVALRESQGLRVAVVDSEDVYDEFSYGIATPQAIKDFLSYAYANWMEPPPRYVFFLGDSSYDYKNNWAPAVPDPTPYLPTYLVFTQYAGETATDEWFSQISGEDPLPDLSLGRLPAASVDEASIMVGKLLEYETTPNSKSWEKNMLLVADDPSEAWEGIFETMNEAVASLMPQGLSDPFRGYLGDYVSAGALNDAIIQKINQGALVVNYSGHAGRQQLAGENIFGNEDITELSNDGEYPFFVSMSCEAGEFIYPEAWGSPSLVETLLRPQGKGVVAALMPTGRTTPDGQSILNQALFEAILVEDIRTLGDALLKAKQTLLANGTQFEETSETFLLFGDPAMELKLPFPRRPTGVMAQVIAEGITTSWDAATDADGGPVSGYNLYRSTTPQGGYTQVNGALITGTQFLDTGVDTETRYYYVVTSVDSDGDQSVLSMEVSATVPESSTGCFIAVATGRSLWEGK